MYFNRQPRQSYRRNGYERHRGGPFDEADSNLDPVTSSNASVSQTLAMIPKEVMETKEAFTAPDTHTRAIVGSWLNQNNYIYMFVCVFIYILLKCNAIIK